MDNNSLTDFIFNAAEETFSIMLGLKVTHGEHSAENPETAGASERVVALIGLAGDYNGTGMMSCSPALACRLSSRMLMADLQMVDSDVLGAISEISNLIFGNVKTMLEEQVGLLGLSIPTVVFGRNFRTRSVGEQWIAVPLKVDESDLDLHMSLWQNHSSTNHNTIHQATAVPV